MARRLEKRQAHLGHSSITVTLDRYGYLFPNAIDKVVRGLALNGWPIRRLRRRRRSSTSTRVGGGKARTVRPTDYESAGHRTSNPMPEAIGREQRSLKTEVHSFALLTGHRT